MGLVYKQKLMSCEELKDAYPVTSKCRETKAARDRQIEQVLTGESDKFLVIIGPCSADREDAVRDYATRVARVQEKVADRLILVPRIFTSKPRTTGKGYKGIVHGPDPHGPSDLQAGLVAARRLHLQVLTETGMTGADELLYIDGWPYIEDLVSYAVVGARSVENQQYRLTISGLECTVGFKNTTSGNLSVMLDSCVAAQSGHGFLYQGYEVLSAGNPLAHCVLRGGVNGYGQFMPNYHYEDLMRVLEMYEQRSLSNPAVIVDVNHANSGKIYSEQPRIAKEVLYSRLISRDVRQLVKGLMIESYIESGNQDVHGGVYGKSITDPCLGWKESEHLIYAIAEYI